MRAKGTWQKLKGKDIFLYEENIPDSAYCKEDTQVFIIGTKGIPAEYGGFETFAENLTSQQQDEHIHYHVACMSDHFDVFEYNGATCFNMEVPSCLKSARAIYFDILAVEKFVAYCKEHPSIVRPIFYICACRIGPFIGALKRKIRKVGGVLYVNPDGHEWKRAKWPGPVKCYWKYSERGMMKHTDLAVCDSKNIELYIRETYEKYKPQTRYIAYGADIRSSVLTDEDTVYQEWMEKRGLRKGAYYLAVGRFVPENNYETMIREFMRSNTDKVFAIITTPNNRFLEKLEERLHFSADSRIKFVGTVYDVELLKKIREGAYGYFHGHEVGGTNPSLLEALGSTELNLLLNVNFNQEVGEGAALYWEKTEGSLAALIEQADAMTEEERHAYGVLAKKRIAEAYSWSFIVEQYETLFRDGR